MSNSGKGFFLAAIAAIVIGGIAVAISESVIPFLIGLAVAAFLVVAGVAARKNAGSGTPHPAMTYSTFRSSYLQKWVRAHGEIGKLATPSGQRRIAPPLTNPNKATLEELMDLPISPQTAGNIFEHRTKGHVFEKLEDLLQIRGIGEITMGNLRDHLVFPSASADQEMESLDAPDDDGSQVSPFEPESELTDYSFDRALVTDSADIVDMLVANNFHFENNCAVLSVDGHPSDVFETVLTMLRRNENLTVFALHDASLEGCRLPLTLRDDRWFPDSSIRIIDLGLRPQHARKLRAFRLQGNRTVVPEELSRTLAPQEVDWLERGYSAELEVLRPERLMRAIYQGFARANLLTSKKPLDDEEVEDRQSPDTGLLDSFFFFSMGEFGGGAGLYASDSFG